MSRAVMIEKPRHEIKRIIYAFGNTQDEIASHFGITRAAIGVWLNKEVVPSYVLKEFETLQAPQIEIPKPVDLLALVSQIEALGFQVTLTKK